MMSRPMPAEPPVRSAVLPLGYRFITSSQLDLPFLPDVFPSKEVQGVYGIHAESSWEDCNMWRASF
jgi:hypothetical protein